MVILQIISVIVQYAKYSCTKHYSCHWYSTTYGNTEPTNLEIALPTEHTISSVIPANNYTGLVFSNYTRLLSRNYDWEFFQKLHRASP